MSTAANPIYSDLPAGAKVLKATTQTYSDLPPGAKVLSSLERQPSGTLATIAREVPLGLASGAGLPETTEATDFSVLPGVAFMLKQPVEALKLVGGGLVESHREAFRKAAEARRAGSGLAGGIREIAATVPIIGPAALAAGEEIGRGIQTGDPAQIAHGAGAGAGLVLTLGLGTKRGAAAASRAVETVGGGVQRGLRAGIRAPVALAERVGLRVPEASKALRQAIQPGINIPRAGESIEIAGPRLQQIAKSERVDLSRVTKEKGEVTGKFLDLVRRGKRQIIAAIEQRLGPVAEFQADAREVGMAMRNSVSNRVRRQFPQQAERIDTRAATYDEPMTLRDIEDAIIDANDDLKNMYKQPVAGESPVSADIKATQAEVRVLRKLLDAKVEELRGAGVKALKREYGALRDVERATARQHAVQTRIKGAGLWEGLAALHAAGDFISGNALGAMKGAAVLTVGRRLQLLRNPDFLIQEAFQGNRPFLPAPEISPAPGRPIRGLLPAPGSIQMPENLPSEPPPPLSPGEMPAAVDLSAATTQAWPKQASINELRSQAAQLERKASSLKTLAAKTRTPKHALDLTQKADRLLAQAKGLKDEATRRLQPREQPPAAPAEPKHELSAEQHAIFEKLPARFGGTGLLPDELIEQTGLPPQRVSSLLTELEMNGLVSRQATGRYVASVAPDTVTVKAPPPKEPWQMLREEYGESQKGRAKEGYAARHKAIVRAAIEQGKPVPEEVRAEFQPAEVAHAQEAVQPFKGTLYSGNEPELKGDFSRGVFLSPEIEVAREFAGRVPGRQVSQFDVELKNPLYARNYDEAATKLGVLDTFREMQKGDAEAGKQLGDNARTDRLLKDAAQKAGYDGIVLRTKAGEVIEANAFEKNALRRKRPTALEAMKLPPAEVAETLPPRTLDTMSDAIALSSPSGTISARAASAARNRLGEKLFGKGGLPAPKGPEQPTVAENNIRRAAELRELARRGMKPRAFLKEAQRLEEEVATSESGRPTPAEAMKLPPSEVLGKKQSALRETFASLKPEEAAQVRKMVDLYKQIDWHAKQQMIQEYKLDRGTWKGLPIEEKFARVLKERGASEFPE